MNRAIGWLYFFAVVVLMLAVMSLFTGCASGVYQLSDEAIDEVGNISTTAVGATKDASVAKERSLHNAYKYRDRMLKDMYLESGFDMQFEMIEVAGVKLYLPKSISYKPQPEFAQDLPAEVSKHPVWGVVDSTVKTASKYGFLGYLTHEVGGVLHAWADGQGNTYNGDFSAVNSLNTSGEAQALTYSQSEIAAEE